MARIYEEYGVEDGSPIGDSAEKGPDSTTRRAAFRFWAFGIAAVVSAIVCLLVLVFVRGTVLPVTLAAVAAASTVFSLLAMRRAVRAMHFATAADTRVSDSVEDWLEQLDDRFAVFRGVRAGDSYVDLVVVGPSGTFTIKASVVPNRGMPDGAKLRAAARERGEVSRLISSLLQRGEPAGVDAVICLAPGHKPVVEQGGNGVWIVAAEKIVPALLKRSGRNGAITRGVSQTGAFSADAVDQFAIEKALAAYWKVRVRKTLDDYTAPLSNRPGSL